MTQLVLLLYILRRKLSLSGKILPVGVSKIRQYFFHRAWAHLAHQARHKRGSHQIAHRL